MKIKQTSNHTVLTAESGYIHRIGSDNYVKSVIMLPSDTIEDYEEVPEKPAFTKDQYDAKVAELVRERYSESEEFAIQRKAMNTMLPNAMSSDENAALQAMTEYGEYNAYVEDCKVKAKDPEIYKPLTSEDHGQEGLA